MKRPADIERVYRYHDGTKHDFDRFARSLGYLDWASQPRPFRSFEGAPLVTLFPCPDAPGRAFVPPPVAYDRLFGGPPRPALPVTAAALGYFLRHALGLSAWKAFKGSRWPLRVNPSSGNLHPTEAYVLTGPLGVADLDDAPGVWHYAPDRHAIERRSSFEGRHWPFEGPGEADAFLVALTSIHWRESWKYGERAFRYCQHDLGHAVAALALSAAMCGWRLAMLPRWSHHDVASVTGIDRDEDFVEAEREEPACMLLVTAAPTDLPAVAPSPSAFVAAATAARWFGRASQLSEDHVKWTFIDEVARATEDRGHDARPPDVSGAGRQPEAEAPDLSADARTIFLQRRSALAFDGVSFTDRDRFLRMLSRVLPGPGAPWDALWWSPRIHLALFVHRVRGVEPGLYVLARAAEAVDRLRRALRPEFSWQPVLEGFPLWLLEAGDCRLLSNRLSCDQEIAADGFFSLGMLADFDAGLETHGASFYRQLFWESGTVGQVLYLEAEAAGARATGIGCFYDDPVHQVLGLVGHAFQSLYHFTVGMPVEDRRLLTEPGYRWEQT